MTRTLLCSLIGGLWAAAAIAAEPPAKQPPEEKLPDYAAWTQLTRGPLRIELRAAEDCRAPARPTAAELARRRSPHAVPAIKVFVNPVAEQGIQAGEGRPLPVGATIVKEKYAHEKDPAPSAYAAMIKREPGFDAEHGDWEYVFVELGKKEEVTRGAIKSCVQCHSIAKDRDYLFRTFSLAKAEKPANEKPVEKPVEK